MDMPPTGERLLTIGEFSQLSQLSVRMLRYYDEHDVLRPILRQRVTTGRSAARPSHGPDLPLARRPAMAMWKIWVAVRSGSST